MGPQKKVGFELEFGSDVSLTTIRNRMKKDLGLEKIKIHEDYSVETSKNFNGELVTPVWNFSEGCKNLRRMLKWMRKNDIKTDETTGLHVNLSYKKPELNLTIDPSAVLLLTDDIKWLKRFNRTSNQYCITPKAELSSCIKSIVSRRHMTIEKLKAYMYHRVMIEYTEADDWLEDASSLDDGHFFDKYFSINLMKLAEKKPYIEYRLIGGDHYHETCREDDVFECIEHCAEVLDKSISTRYEGVKTRYVKNMLSPAQRIRIKNK